MIWTYLAGITTTIAGAYFVHLLTHDRWWREYRLRKLEELSIAVQNHEVTVSEYYTRSAAYLVQPEDAEGLLEQNNILRTDYLKALQEDEKSAAIIPMIVNIYFVELLPAWQNIEAARHRLSTESRKAYMFDKGKREALGKIQREAISKSVGLAILKEYLPALATFKAEMITKIVQVAKDIGGEKPWPINTVVRWWERA